MNKPNLERVEKEIEKKYKKREKKQKPAMKVSGAGVKKIQKLIITGKK